MSKIEVDIVRSIEELTAVFAIRRKCFIEEQNISENMEFDGSDFAATHLVGKIDGTPVATMRLRYFADHVRFERMCKLPSCKEYEKKENVSIVQEMLKYAGNYLGQKGFSQALCLCEEKLLKHWLSHGHKLLENKKPIVIGNKTFYAITYEFPRNPNPITLNSDLRLQVAPEGHWPQIPDQMRILLQQKKSRSS